MVDDRPEDQKMNVYFLGKCDKLRCRFQIADSARDALAIMSRDAVDVVLLDINMPGMDGFEMLEHMNSDNRLRHIPVIMCTGSDYEKDRSRAAALGARGYLVKPPRFDALRPFLDHLTSLQVQEREDGRYLRRAQLSEQTRTP